MKKLISLLALCLLFTGCSSCSKQDVGKVSPTPTVSVKPVEAPVTHKLINKNGWSLVIPVDFLEDQTSSSDVAMYVSKEKHQLISLTKEEFAGTPEQYMLLGVKSLKSGGISTQGAMATKLNGYDFTVIACEQDGLYAWIWSSVIDGHGYILSCGGQGGSSELYADCFAMVNTFKIIK